MINNLNWSRTWDDNDNTIWEAPGPYTDEEGGSLGSWRLIHKLVRDIPVWIADHDAELEGLEGTEGEWLNLRAAMSDIFKIHHEILEEASKENATSNPNL